jgi:hypothetical protein
MFFDSLFFSLCFFRETKSLVNTQKRGTGASAYKLSSFFLFFFSLQSQKEKQKMAQKEESPFLVHTNLSQPKSPTATNLTHATTPSPSKVQTHDLMLTHLLPTSRNPQSTNNNKAPPRPPLPPHTNKTPHASTKLRFSTPADLASGAAAVVSVTAGVAPVLVGVGARR